MLDQKGLTTNTAILIAAAMISLSVLLSGGVIKIKGLTQGNSAPTQAGQPTPAPSAAPAKVTLDVGRFPIKGKKDAKVTIIEFADFRCPFCEKFFTDTESQILKDYVDTGKARFAFRQYAFLGPASNTAANAAECANEQNKFWEMHDYFYKNQPPESDTSMYTSDKLTTVATSLGLNGDQFKNCLDSNKYASKASDDLATGQKDGVSGTPTVFIGKTDGNNALDAVPVVGAQPYASFKSQIDALLQ